MKRSWPLIALGVGAFLLFGLLTVPASVLLSQLASSGISAAGVEGTAWNGKAQVLQVGGVNLGGVEWDLHVLALFTGRLNADVKVTRSDGFAQTKVTATPAGSVSFQELTASLPLSALPSSVVPGGWAGMLNLKLVQLTLENGWPIGAEGTIDVIDVTGPARKPVNMGSYKVTFPAQDGSAADDTLTGALTDIGGPLQISGTLQLKTDRSYVVEGLVATRPNAPRDVVNALQYLGAPDAQGRRPFSIAGTI